MKIIDILDQRIIDFNLVAKTKEEILLKMSQQLKNAHYISDVDLFVESIYEREKQGVTGIGNGIAIPHGKSDAVKKIGIAIAKLNEPVEWESLDNEKVTHVFLFAVSNNHDYAKNHMKLLADIARKLGDDDAVSSLKSCHSIETLYDIFQTK